MARLIPGCTFHVLVIFYISNYVPLLLDVVEVALKLLPAGVTLFESEVLVELWFEELVDWGVAINTGAGILVPIPDPPEADPFSYTLTFKPCLRNLFSVLKAPNPAPTIKTSNSVIGSDADPMTAAVMKASR